MFTRGRSLRAIAAIVIATALLASSFASTFAAVANVGVGGGWNTSLNNVTGVSGATPSMVSPGKVAGFYLSAKNNDSANLSSFFLTASTAATPLGAFWTHDPTVANPTWTACDTSNGLKCTFGAFNSGAAVYILAAFTLPTATSTSKTNCLIDPKVTQPTNSYGHDPLEDPASDNPASWVCVDFQFGSSSGFVTGKNKSRGDAYHWFDFVGTDTGQDSAAQFPFCDLSAQPVNCSDALLSLNDTKTNFGKNNPQWTQVLAPNGAFNSFHASSAIGVADGVASPCTGSGDPAECSIAFLGQWSKVDVNDGGNFSPDFIKIDIGVYGVGVSKISHVYHFYEVSGVLNVEVLPKCASSAGPTGSDPSCFWATSLGGNASQVTVWTHFNGKLNIG
jgi:hypothetical protein